MAIKMIAPAGIGGVVMGLSGTNYVPASDGTISNVSSFDVVPFLRGGFRLFSTLSHKAVIRAALTADLISIKAAATPVNGAVTIAAQPPQARKLQVRVVIGTPTTTAITAGTLALVGFDQDGAAVSETLSLVTTSSATLKTANCYASLTSATVAGYAAAGSGTGNTLGIGVSNDFGVPTAPNGLSVDLACTKATKITTTITGAVTGLAFAAADDVASTTTVDATARTIAPTTAPDPNGLIDFEFTYTYGVPA